MNLKCSAKVVALAAGLLVTGFFVAQFFNHYPKSSGEWASWVQAIGTILAVLVAIAISQLQKETARTQKIYDDDRRRTQVLRGLHTEMSMALVGMQNIGKEIKRAIEDRRFAIHNSHQNKVIFDSVHELVLTVPSDDLRSNIISFYSGIQSFIRELEIHTERVKSHQKGDKDETESAAFFVSLRDDQRYIIDTLALLEKIKVEIDNEMSRLAII